MPFRCIFIIGVNMSESIGEPLYNLSDKTNIIEKIAYNEREQRLFIKACILIRLVRKCGIIKSAAIKC